MNYLTSQKGSTNILITSPHGGDLKPINIRDRIKGKLHRDSYSRTFTYSLLHRFNYEPYYIISNIHRSKVDLNRKIDEACNSLESEVIFHQWNSALLTFLQEIRNRYKRVLYVDIHSHNNSDEIQLGYDITKSEYEKLSKGNRKVNSTLDSLNIDLYELVFGEFSLQSTLEKKGYKIFNPLKNGEHFNGGYNVETFSGSGVAGVQIEFPVNILQDKNKRINLSYHLKESIEIFKKIFIDR